MREDVGLCQSGWNVPGAARADARARLRAERGQVMKAVAAKSAEVRAQKAAARRGRAEVAEGSAMKRERKVEALPRAPSAPKRGPKAERAKLNREAIEDVRRRSRFR